MQTFKITLFTFLFLQLSHLNLLASPFTAKDYYCTLSSGTTQGHENRTIQAELLFKEIQVDGFYSIYNSVGYIKISSTYENKLLTLDSDFYYGTFGPKKLDASSSTISNAPKNSRQYNDFNAVATNGFDGGEMTGTLVLESEPYENNTYLAHYIFKAGISTSGIINFECKLK